MFRRSCSLTLLLAFTAGQIAVIQHAHSANGGSFDRDIRPHIHLSWTRHAVRSHDDGNPRHHHHDGSHSSPSSSDATFGHESHESDAVHLPSEYSVSSPVKGIASAHNFDLIAKLAIPIAPSATSVSGCVTGPFFPGDCTPGHPLYLALRALRI